MALGNHLIKNIADCILDLMTVHVVLSKFAGILDEGMPGNGQLFQVHGGKKDTNDQLNHCAHDTNLVMGAIHE